MMAVEFPGMNAVFRKPSDMSDEQCGSLRALVGTDDEGFPFVMSVWQPSKEDIDAINAGSPICLKILGHTQPPVCLFTVDGGGQPNV